MIKTNLKTLKSQNKNDMIKKEKDFTKFNFNNLRFLFFKK